MRAFSAVLCVVVAACGSTGSKMAHVRPGIADVHPSLGRIYFYRPSEFPPRGQGFQRLDVTVNGRSVGVAAPGASFFIETEPGLKNLSIGPEAARNIVFDLKPGETRYVRAEVVMGWIVNTPQLRAVDQAVAEAEMADTTYYGSLDRRTSLSPRDLASLECQREADRLPPAFSTPPSGTPADILAGALVAYSALVRAAESAQIEKDCMTRKGYSSQE